MGNSCDPPASVSSSELQQFTRALLRDVQALEQMLEQPELFEHDIRRIGAEQEMFLVDASMQPAPIATQILADANDPRLTPELALFNLEANVGPRPFGADCLSQTHAELDDVVNRVRAVAASRGADVLLAGILPTLRTSHLTLANMTPKPRYAQLDRAMKQSRGGAFEVFIKGVDELHVASDSVMLESCNTSFQVHFQVAPEEFARLYNAAQAVTAPVLAAAANSGLFLGKRLWSETRVALFQHGVDSRSSAHRVRGLTPRVCFGDSWVRDSVLEIFRAQIERFRVFLPCSVEEDPLAILRAGGVPELSALCRHNGTIYRWNRACYGITEGRPHLRIENRVLPAGPTVADEVANAAFFFGLMSALLERSGNIVDDMQFADAKANFVAAARHGLKAQFTWFDNATYPAAKLITEQLLPMAREGLQARAIDPADIEHYLEIIEARTKSGRTGSQWMFDSLAALGSGASAGIREQSLTASMLEMQLGGEPVHTWPLARLTDESKWRQLYRTVGQFMTTDLFTVRREDLVDLAANVMDWRHIEHVPVEDDDGRLVGIITYRMLLRLLTRPIETDDAVAGTGVDRAKSKHITAGDIMRPDPLTVSPDTRTLKAMHLMRDHAVGCLPVVDQGRLVGIVTQSDLITVSTSLLERYLDEK